MPRNASGARCSPSVTSSRYFIRPSVMPSDTMRRNSWGSASRRTRS
jgi:hypothetical protein